MFGGTGTGKTNDMGVMLVQDIEHFEGVGVICPMKELADRAVEFCYQAGRKDVIYFEPGDPNWVTPFDLRELEGEPLVAAERTAQALLAAWGIKDTNLMPQLEQWLTIVLLTSRDADIDLPYAWHLLEHKTKLREKFAPYISDDAVRELLLSLDKYRHHDLVHEVGSTLRKLLRFTFDGPVARSMGLGANAINFKQIMDEGKVFIASLPEGKGLSQPMQKLFGTLIVNGFYHAAMCRTGEERPFYLYIDEAPMFATHTLGNALDQCRQKKLYFTFAVQRPGQFKSKDPELYDAIKNGAQTKIVFRATNRVDALEMIDDIVFGLAEPQIKYELWGIAYRPVNTYLPSYSSTQGGGDTWDQGESYGISAGSTNGGSLAKTDAWSDSRNASDTKKENEVIHHTDATGLVLQGGTTEGRNWATSLATTQTKGFRNGGSGSWSDTVTWAPGTIHIPENELKQVVLMSLEDRRRMESDALMQFPDGAKFVKVKGQGAVAVKGPLVVNLSNPEDIVEFKQTLHRAHSVPRADADRIIAARRKEIATIPPKEPTFDDDYTFSPSTSWLKNSSD